MVPSLSGGCGQVITENTGKSIVLPLWSRTGVELIPLCSHADHIIQTCNK